MHYSIKLGLISFFFSTMLALSFTACAKDPTLLIYSARKEHLIKPILAQFTQQTGIQIKLYTGKPNALIERLKSDGDQSEADILITTDAGNLWYAATQKLFQPMDISHIQKNIPSYLRDQRNYWTGLSVRARTLVYNQNKVNPNDLSTYQALANPKWKGRLCLRTSKKIYNKSLVASMIAHNGSANTETTLTGWVANIATKPFAKDSQVLNALAAGQCDVGIVNTYYYGRMEAKNPKTPVRLFWANQNTTGTHINVSGAGILKNAPHAKQAQQLINWLTDHDAQTQFGKANKEYPANSKVRVEGQVANWGAFKQDALNLSEVGELQAEAVKLMQQAGYQ